MAVCILWEMNQPTKEENNKKVSMQRLSLFWSLVFLKGILTSKTKRWSRFLNRYNKINVDGIASQEWMTREYLGRDIKLDL